MIPCGINLTLLSMLLHNANASWPLLLEAAVTFRL